VQIKALNSELMSWLRAARIQAIPAKLLRGKQINALGPVHQKIVTIDE